MTIKLNKISSQVEALIKDESFRITRATNLCWNMFLEQLPYSISDETSDDFNAMDLEEVVRNHINNNQCINETDYIAFWANEFLYDVDFEELSKRKKLQNEESI